MAPQGEDKNQDKGEGKASNATISQSKQVADPQVPQTKTQDIVFFVYCFRVYFFFFKDLYFVFIINEDTLLLF